MTPISLQSVKQWLTATSKYPVDLRQHNPLHSILSAALGGTLDGPLRQYAVISDESLVSIPSHLSYAEASTLPCAALTAWNCLYGGGRRVGKGDMVLTQGTGGVSLFTVQFAIAAGAEVIATTPPW